MPSVIILDNVKQLDGAALASAFTSTRFSGRVVGSSVTAEVQNLATWFATGNNPNLDDEITRRSLPIWLDAGVEHPHEQDHFRHPDLKAWARENRRLLICAALTIIQYWYQAGKPLSTKAFGSFEAWTKIIGGILECAGIEGIPRQHQSIQEPSRPGYSSLEAVCSSLG